MLPLLIKQRVRESFDKAAQTYDGAAVVQRRVCDRLLKEEKVGVVPGTCFGNQGENHIRISYAASRENIAEALKRIGHFVDKYKK